MRGSTLPRILWLSAMGGAMAAEVVYVTDLVIFTSLAPCAQDAVSENVQDLTESACPSLVTALEQCVCTQDSNFASISSQISSSVSWNCGGTATDDLASAFTVLTAYCNQNTLFSFPAPTPSLTEYITDLPAFSNLAPCAGQELSYAVMSMSYELCPPDPGDLATCVCEKNQNSLAVSQTINTSVMEGCSSQTDDISSAQAIFAAYCNMLSGTTSFPTPSNPPGDMTYYITDLPQYSSLAPCAQDALSYAVLSQTYELCPSGPEALASCACLKSSMPQSISSLIASNVDEECASTATDDVSSALNVYNFYCSAAKALVTASGVSNSVAQTYGTSVPTGGGSGSGSGGSNGSGGSGNGNGNGNGSGSGSHSGPSTALIAGAAAGGVALIAIVCVVVFFVMRSARKRKTAQLAAQQQPPSMGYDPNYGGAGQPELAGTPIPGGAALHPPPPGSPSPSMLKAGATPRTDTVSPVSPHLGLYGAPPPLPGPQAPELPANAISYSPPMSELQGQNNQLPFPGYNNAGGRMPQEAPGQQIYEFPPQNPVYEAGSTPLQQQYRQQGQQAPHGGQQGQGQFGWQSGPVPAYAELDGQGYEQQPHAR